ncbi:MAG: M12 family metallo-peptidase [Candidatus Paceibacterota bacterium]
MEYEDPYKKIDDIDEIDVEPEPRPLWQRVLLRTLQIVIGLAVIAGLIYLSGFREFFFYRKTPDNIEAQKIESVLQAEEIELPITTYIMKSEKGTKGSSRTKEDIVKLVQETNKIWNQADIKLNLVEVRTVSMGEDQLKDFAKSPYEHTDKLEDFNPQVINTFFVGNLEGPSGLAYMGANNILVADYTSSHDFLVFAHEIGHVLGLEHTTTGLMSTKAGGPNLSEEEIKKARMTAETIKN